VRTVSRNRAAAELLRTAAHSRRAAAWWLDDESTRRVEHLRQPCDLSALVDKLNDRVECSRPSKCQPVELLCPRNVTQKPAILMSMRLLATNMLIWEDVKPCFVSRAFVWAMGGGFFDLADGSWSEGCSSDSP
jgi:hypothetical protein